MVYICVYIHNFLIDAVGSGISYGLEADIYSFGILLHQICTLKQPYASLRSIEAFRSKVIQGGARPKLSLIKHSELRALIKSCWAVTPSSRPSFNEITRILESIIKRSRSNARPQNRFPRKKSEKQQKMKISKPTLNRRHSLSRTTLATNLSSYRSLSSRRSSNENTNESSCSSTSTQ